MEEPLGSPRAGVVPASYQGGILETLGAHHVSPDVRMAAALPAMRTPHKRAFRMVARRTVLSRAFLVLIGLMLGVFAGEAVLQVMERTAFPLIGSQQSEAQELPDAELGYRIAPLQGGHDANGFRNEGVLPRPDIVAIGDSQTWGNNAELSETWPAVLGGLENRSVYNMGVYGYGPIQYEVLLERALSLSPKIVILGLYFGNDLYDAYRMVYQQEDIDPHFRLPNAPSSLYVDDVGRRTDMYYEERGKFLAEFDPPWWYALEQDFLHWFATARLIERRGGLTPLESAYRYDRDKAWAQAFPDDAATYDSKDVHAVFTTTWRLEALDLDEPRIAEGLRITEDVLSRSRTGTDVAGIKLAVLLIPTKESVHANAVERLQGGLDPTYTRLVRMETRVRAEIASHCERYRIVCIDALPALQQAVGRDEQVYPSHTDGHPNVHGYFVIASALREAFERLGW
jgi:lysophospholipase L1-like esterase